MNLKEFKNYEIYYPSQREVGKSETMVIPSEVPAEVHNAAVAARKNRKSCTGEQLQKMTHSDQQEFSDTIETKSPQKGKRKAPAPPSRNTSIESTNEIQDEKSLNGISDYKEPEQINTQSTVDKGINKVGENSTCNRVTSCKKFLVSQHIDVCSFFFRQIINHLMKI